MARERLRYWSWTVKTWGTSAFVVAHLAALVVWNLPGGAIQERFGPWVSYYMLPTGLWQDWGMFAPDPYSSSTTLEAITLDAHGTLRTQPFPTLGNRPVVEAALAYRHAKFASTVGVPHMVTLREFVARSVIRAQDIPPESFPVDVQLYYNVRPIPRPDETIDATTPITPTVSILQTYRFATREEAEP